MISQKVKKLKKKLFPAMEKEQQKRFYLKLQGSFTQVLQYQDPKLQQQALSILPLEALLERARKSGKAGGGGELRKSDQFVREVLSWFKGDFFKWTNSPQCSFCASATQAVGMAPSLPEEKKFLAERVELYSCNLCKSLTRFPRYNHAEILLQTRHVRFLENLCVLENRRSEGKGAG